MFVNGEPIEPLFSAVSVQGVVKGVVKGVKFTGASDGYYTFRVRIDKTWYGFSESYGKLTHCVFADSPEVKDTDYKVCDGFLTWKDKRISNGAAIQTFVDAKTADLEAELEDAKEEAKKDAAQADEAWQECNDQDEDLRTVEAEYQDQIAELKAENARLQAVNARFQAENERLQAEKARLQAENERLQKDLDTVQEQQFQFREVVYDQLVDTVARLQEELEVEKAKVQKRKLDAKGEESKRRKM
jgi:chromosome segregation ATPase